VAQRAHFDHFGNALAASALKPFEQVGGEKNGGDGEAANEGMSLFMFGGFIGTNADRLILPKLISTEVLGIYAIAFTMWLMPRLLLLQVGNRVIYPAMSQKVDMERSAYRALIGRYRQKVLLLSVLFVAPGIALADVVIEVLYDDRYRQAGWMLGVLMCGLWPFVLSLTTEWTLLSIGKPKYHFWANVARILPLTVGSVLAYQWFGLLGFIVVIAAGPLMRYLGLCVGLAREKLLLVRQDLISTGLLVLFVVALVAARWCAGFGTFFDDIAL